MFALFALALCEELTPKPMMNFMKDRICHFECFNTVRVIERLLNDGKDAAFIKSNISAHCLKLQTPRNETCTKMAGKVEKVIDHLQNGKRPDFICDQLGFTRHFRLPSDIPRSTCVTVVDAIKKNSQQSFLPHLKRADKLLEEPEKKQEGVHHMRPMNPFHPFTRRFGVCQEFETPKDKMICHMLTRVVMRDMHTEIREGLESSAICDKMQEKGLVKFGEEK